MVLLTVFECKSAPFPSNPPFFLSPILLSAALLLVGNVALLAVDINTAGFVLAVVLTTRQSSAQY